jgi:hypothetical protein
MMRFAPRFLFVLLALSLTGWAQNPPRIKRRTPPAPQTEPVAEPPDDSARRTPRAPTVKPFGEIEFYKLVQQIRQGVVSPAEAATALDARGVAFEVTDEILARARTLGATGDVVTALIRAEERRAGGGGVAPGGRAPQPEASETDAPPAFLDDEATGREAQRIAKLPFFEQVRAHALNAREELPDFIAAQIITRYRQVGGRWQVQDVLGTEVSYEKERGEMTKMVTINGRPTNKTYEQVGGNTSVGGFSAQQIAPFQVESKTKFSEASRERYRNRDCVIYDFRVPRETSRQRLQGAVSGEPVQEVVTGYHGSIWVDRETKRIVRIEQAADDIPPDFILSQSETSVEYDWREVSGKRYWLPIKAEVIHGSDRYRTYFRNVIEFRDYRKFDGDVKILD